MAVVIQPWQIFVAAMASRTAPQQPKPAVILYHQTLPTFRKLFDEALFLSTRFQPVQVRPDELYRLHLECVLSPPALCRTSSP